MVIAILLLGINPSVFSQELFCLVEVNSRQIDGSERLIFDQMEQDIFKLVNGRKWTTDEFEVEERIDCSILINLTERLNNNRFRGNIQVQASRPVFGTSYDSPIMNVRDDKFTIEYSQFEPLVYNESGYSGELVSVIAFYLYMILAYDYDSFSLEGGTKYFQEAQRIVNNAQSSAESGWKAFEEQNNRYWLLDNALSARFKPLRRSYYEYHRKGYDQMTANVIRGRAAVTKSLRDLRAIHNVAPSSYNLQVFFNAKFQELENLYKEASPAEKTEIAELLTLIDPGHSSNWNKLRK